MNPSVFILLSCLSCGLLVSGCATAPTPKQEAIAASSVRIATVAYITRGKTAVEQADRAGHIFNITKQLRAYITENGNVVVNLNALAGLANQKIMASTLSANDKQLAQAIVTEALFIAEDQARMVEVNVGAANAALVRQMFTEIERAAWIFIPSQI